ncbi:MAG: glycosyl hydrolase family 28-related protein [Planctomycetota bacterium]
MRRLVLGVLAGLVVATAPGEAAEKETTMGAQRNLRAYANADGQPVDGLDDETDDTSALRAALSEGPGVVFVPAGFYRWGDVTIPRGVTLAGAGRATVVSRARGTKRVFVQDAVNDWRLRDLALDGGASPSDWRSRQDLGENGLEVSGCTGFEISGVVANNFQGAGIVIRHTAASPYCRWATAANVFNLSAGGNHTGLRLDTRAEYMNASMLTLQGNVIGCTIHAGNAKLTNSTITNNLTGILIEDHDNGSHGTISNTLVNHNQEYALLARDVQYGMMIDNCAFFGGTIALENAKGVLISSSILACHIRTTGELANRISGNYVIERGETFDFSPATIVEDNFTEHGPWEKNR